MDNPTPYDQRRGDVALIPEEKATIVTQLSDGCSKTVLQAYHEALDTGQVVASLSSYYRIARDPFACPGRLAGAPQQPSRRVRRGQSTSRPPQLHATRPFQVIVWDITILPLLYRGQSVALHMALDLYSRAIVGFILAESPCATTAKALFNDVITLAHEHGHTVESVHSDNGRTMKSHVLKELFASHGITQSFTRPRVSDDNAHMESSFSTMKNDLTYPDVFDDIDQAAAWVTDWVKFYNTARVHSGLAYFTPHDVLTGTWAPVWQKPESHQRKTFQQQPRPLQAQATDHTHPTNRSEVQHHQYPRKSHNPNNIRHSDDLTATTTYPPFTLNDSQLVDNDRFTGFSCR
ncbi:transposase family protein [Corynebacterium hindlerae]|uniref:Transposase family protein n=1 Tax=Corynebacterium hindlerae TaxID=699041 RepID=A0A7G5FFQ9_9CORY|nr:DDE-type integrase/transposase/recombinase [Corynebacterium hindlerae]QMV85450.1 transposase family protein [Corynebacterium hindlerae]